MATAYKNDVNNKNELIIGKDIDKDLFARILISAERYACGQTASYIVDFVSTEIKRYASILTREQMKTIIDDVEVSIAGDDAGWNIDANAWASLIAHLKPIYDLGDDDIIFPVEQTPMSISQDDWQMLSCGAALRYDMTVKKDKRNVAIREYIHIIQNLPVRLAASAKSIVASDIVMTDQWTSFMHDSDTPADLHPLRMLVGLPDATSSACMNTTMSYKNNSMIGA